MTEAAEMRQVAAPAPGLNGRCTSSSQRTCQLGKSGIEAPRIVAVYCILARVPTDRRKVHTPAE